MKSNNSYTENYNDNKSFFPNRDIDKTTEQDSRTTRTYDSINSSDFTADAASFPLFVAGKTGGPGPFFHEGDVPKASRIFSTLLDININSTNPIGVLFIPNMSAPNLCIVDLVTNAVIQTFNIYSGTGSYSSFKPVIGMIAVRQEAMLYANDALGSLLDALVSSSNFNYRIFGNTPMNVNAPLEDKEPDVDGRDGVTISLLCSPFSNSIASDATLTPNKRLHVYSGTTATVFIKPFSRITILNISNVGGVITLEYVDSVGVVVPIIVTTIFPGQIVNLTLYIPVTRVTVSGGPSFSLDIEELLDDAPVGFVRISASTVARTFRISSRTACELLPKEDRMADIQTFLPRRGLGHSVHRELQGYAMAKVCRTPEVRGRAMSWADIAIQAYRFLQPTLYKWGHKLVDLIKPEKKNNNVKQGKLGRAMMKESTSKNNNPEYSYLKVYYFTGIPILCNNLIDTDPEDGSTVVLWAKPDEYIKKLMLDNNFKYAHIHVINTDPNESFFGKALQHVEMDAPKNNNTIGKAMQSNKTNIGKSSIKKDNVSKESGKNEFVKVLASKFSLAKVDSGAERASNFCRVKGATMLYDAYQVFPVVVTQDEEIVGSEWGAVMMTSTPVADYNYDKTNITYGESVFEFNTGGNYLGEKEQLIHIFFNMMMERGIPDSEIYNTIYITLFSSIDFIDLSWTAAYYALVSGAPNGQFCTGVITTNEYNAAKMPTWKLDELSAEGVKEKYKLASRDFPLLVVDKMAGLKDSTPVSVFFGIGQKMETDVSIFCDCVQVFRAVAHANIGKKYNSVIPVKLTKAVLKGLIESIPSYNRFFAVQDKSITIPQITLLKNILGSSSIDNATNNEISGIHGLILELTRPDCYTGVIKYKNKVYSIGDIIEENESKSAQAIKQQMNSVYQATFQYDGNTMARSDKIYPLLGPMFSTLSDIANYAIVGSYSQTSDAWGVNIGSSEKMSTKSFESALIERDLLTRVNSGVQNAEKGVQSLVELLKIAKNNKVKREIINTVDESKDFKKKPNPQAYSEKDKGGPKAELKPKQKGESEQIKLGKFEMPKEIEEIAKSLDRVAYTELYNGDALEAINDLPIFYLLTGSKNGTSPIVGSPEAIAMGHMGIKVGLPVNFPVGSKEAWLTAANKIKETFLTRGVNGVRALFENVVISIMENYGTEISEWLFKKGETPKAYKNYEARYDEKHNLEGNNDGAGMVEDL